MHYLEDLHFICRFYVVCSSIRMVYTTTCCINTKYQYRDVEFNVDATKSDPFLCWGPCSLSHCRVLSKAPEGEAVPTKASSKN